MSVEKIREALKEVTGLAYGLADDDPWFAEQRNAHSVLQKAGDAIELAKQLEAALPAVVERLQVIERMDPESQFASIGLCKRIASEALSLLQAEKKT